MKRQSETPDEVALLKRIARGDTQAFDVFYQRYNGLIYTYIFRLVHDELAAEDLLQETFLAIWQGAHRFSGRSQVKTWVLSIAHHHVVTWYRTNHNHNGNAHYSDPETLDRFADGLDGVQVQRDDLPTEEIQQALDQLSPDHRAVLELAFYYDCSYAEIAAIVGCPVGTVKSRLNAARRQLQVLLAHLRPTTNGGAS